MIGEVDPRTFREHHQKVCVKLIAEKEKIKSIPYGFNFMSQTSPVSDRNFIEQYYKRPWDLDPNFDTFVHTKEQQDNRTGKK